MRNISTGAGLCVLGFCVLAAAVVSSSHLANTAIAAGDGRPAAISMPEETLPAHVMHPIGLPTGTGFVASAHTLPRYRSSNVSASPACQTLEPDIRFTEVHPIDLCFDDTLGGYRSIGSTDSGSQDINGDGVLENFWWNGYFGLNTNSSPNDGVLMRDEVVFDGTTTSIRHQAVLLAAPFLDFIQAQASPAQVWTGNAFAYGWRDMDSDGDLDFIVYLSWSYPEGTSDSRLVWAENTGYPASPKHNPYDLDQDGHVNTADLSLLLMEFTD